MVLKKLKLEIIFLEEQISKKKYSNLNLLKKFYMKMRIKQIGAPIIKYGKKIFSSINKEKILKVVKVITNVIVFRKTAKLFKILFIKFKKRQLIKVLQEVKILTKNSRFREFIANNKNLKKVIVYYQWFLEFLLYLFLYFKSLFFKYFFPFFNFLKAKYFPSVLLLKKFILNKIDPRVLNTLLSIYKFVKIRIVDILAKYIFKKAIVILNKIKNFLFQAIEWKERHSREFKALSNILTVLTITVTFIYLLDGLLAIVDIFNASKIEVLAKLADINIEFVAGPNQKVLLINELFVSIFSGVLTFEKLISDSQYYSRIAFRILAWNIFDGWGVSWVYRERLTKDYFNYLGYEELCYF